MKIEPAGDRAYYAIGNFSQRVDLAQAICLASLRDDQCGKAATALFEKIRRLWKARNYLVHSHYAYVELDNKGNMLSALSGEGRNLGKHPKIRAMQKTGAVLIDSEGEKIPQPQTAHHGFAYEKRQLDGSVKYVLVNAGTFQNHADQLSKRLRQIRTLTKAIRTMHAPLKWGSFAASHNKQSPRAIRNQREYQEHLDRSRERPHPPQSSPR